jgi:hypothetical protein
MILVGLGALIENRLEASAKYRDPDFDLIFATYD